MIDSSFYSLLYESSNPVRRWLHLRRKKWVTERLKKYIEPSTSKKAIEVGFGDGTYLKELLALTSDVSAFDYSSVLIRDAVSWFGNKVTFIEGDIRSFEGDKHYDIILCTEVIEHIRESRIAMKNMSSWLKVGGVLVLTTPNRYSIMEIFCRLLRFPIVQKIATFIYREPVQDLGHIGLLTEAELRNMFLENSLEVIEHDNMGLYIPVITEVIRSEYTVKVFYFLERWMAKIPLKKLLWTQVYVLKRI